MKKITLSLSDAQARRLREIASRSNITPEQLVVIGLFASIGGHDGGRRAVAEDRSEDVDCVTLDDHLDALRDLDRSYQPFVNELQRAHVFELFEARQAARPDAVEEGTCHA